MPPVTMPNRAYPGVRTEPHTHTWEKTFLMTHGALLKQQIAGRAEERVVAKQRELDETYMRLVTDEVHALRVKQAALERIEAHNATGCAPLPVHATAKVLGITAKKVFNEQKRSRALW